MKYTHLPLQKSVDIKQKSLDFILNESEKRLNASVSSNINNRQSVYKLISVFVPVVTVTCGYALSNPNWILLWPAIGFVIIELIGAALLVLSVWPQILMPGGTHPSNLVQDPMFPDVTQTSEYDQYRFMVLEYCDHIETKIKHNENKNSIMASRASWGVLFCALAGPLVFVSASLWVFYR